MPPYMNEEGYDDDNIGLLGRSVACGENASWVGVPLVGVSVEADAVDFIAEFKLTQCYENWCNYPIEAKYIFPMDESAAVCGFQAEYEDGRIVKGVVKEKNQAKREFNEAVRVGKQANLLESVRRDIFSLEVGNLPAGAYVKITITYITALKARDDAMAFILPTYVAPRYTPPDETMSFDEISPIGDSATGVELFGMSIKVNFSCLSNIKEIKCPTHEAEVSYSSWFQGKTGHVLLQASMDRELVALVVEEDCHQPRAVVERSPTGSLAGFVTLFPKMEFPDLKREFVFLIDRSGSMAGSNIKQASETLLLFLRALPVSCTFNIVGFGSGFSALFPRAVTYNDHNLQIASQYALDMTANMGGTEIKNPLQHVFSQPFPPNVDRQVFVLTDGQVSNDLQVFDVVRRYCSNGKCRLFSVGMGCGVSRHLVEGMARAGCGTARFVESSSSVELREKVLGQLKQAMQPSLNDVSIKWNFPAPESSVRSQPPPQPPVKTLLGYRSPAVDCTEPPVEAAPKPKIFPCNIPPVFNKEKFLLFAIFPDGCGMPTSVTVACATSEGLLETTLDIPDGDVFQGTIAHKMAARAAISEYEDRSKTRSVYRPQWTGHVPGKVISQGEALQLALANGLASEQTSFIAVLDNPGMEAPTTIGHQPLDGCWAKQERDTRNHIHHTWHDSCAHPTLSAGESISLRSAPPIAMVWPNRGSSFLQAPMARQQRPVDWTLGEEGQKTSHPPPPPPQQRQSAPPRMDSPPGSFYSGVDMARHGISLSMDDDVEETTRRVGFNPSFAPSNISFAPRSAMMPPPAPAAGMPKTPRMMPPPPRCGFGTPAALGAAIASPAALAEKPNQLNEQGSVFKKHIGWDAVSRREVGIKLDLANAAGKSCQFQAVVHKRVNDMHLSQQKAIQEIKEREEQKKRVEVEEDMVRKKLDPMIKAWSEEHGKKKQLRALLGTLHTILWPEANWKPIGFGDLLDENKCKRAFHKASRIVHPDKTHHLDAEKRFLANSIFNALSQAKTPFDDQTSTLSGSSDALLNLCVLQRANGSFVWDESLAQALSWTGKNMDIIIRAVEASVGGIMGGCSDDDGAAKATALAVVALRVFFAEQKSSWELQEEKALHFLSSSCGLTQVDIDSLLNTTEGNLRA